MSIAQRRAAECLGDGCRRPQRRPAHVGRDRIASRLVSRRRRLAYLSKRGNARALVGRRHRRGAKSCCSTSRAQRRGRPTSERPACRVEAGAVDDADRILADRAARGRRVLYVSALDPFAPRALTDGTSSVGYPAWSPDERNRGGDQGWQLDARRRDRRPDGHAATADERARADVGPQLVARRAAGGRRAARRGVGAAVDRRRERPRRGHHRAGPPRVYVRYPDWSPRGNVVLFERGEMRGNIWMLAIQ